ncbi:MAG: cytochrome d ubiquinol oxidase subunit II [Syntrophaceae bacterium]
MEMSWMVVFWTFAITVSVMIYVLLDGFDLGVGILSGLTRDPDMRDEMVNAIIPFWDGNEVWLVIAGASLFSAFPLVYSIMLPAFYLPLALMLIALMFRGVAFEFRHRAVRLRPLWEGGLFLGSLIAAFVQGAFIGRLIQGLPVLNGRFVGGAFSWLTPFAVFCGLGLIIGYMLLGAGWLVMKTQGNTRDWAYARLGRILGAVLLILAAASLYILVEHPRVLERWQAEVWLVSCPLVIILSAGGLLTGLGKRIDTLPFAMAVIILAASFLALIGSFWPYVIPFSLTLKEAAAPQQSLAFLFYGAGIVLFPLVLFYTAWVYWVLRGKTSAA